MCVDVSVDQPLRRKYVQNEESRQIGTYVARSVLLLRVRALNSSRLGMFSVRYRLMRQKHGSQAFALSQSIQLRIGGCLCSDKSVVCLGSKANQSDAKIVFGCVALRSSN